MEIYKIVGVGLATLVCVLVLKQTKPEIALIVGVCGGAVVILMTLESLSGVLSTFNLLVKKSGLSSSIFSTVLKIVGIGYMSEFAASVCLDSGCSGLGDKILLAGKITILALSMPIVTNILEIILGLLP